METANKKDANKQKHSKYPQSTFPDQLIELACKARQADQQNEQLFEQVNNLILFKNKGDLQKHSIEILSIKAQEDFQYILTLIDQLISLFHRKSITYYLTRARLKVIKQICKQRRQATNGPTKQQLIVQNSVPQTQSEIIQQQSSQPDQKLIVQKSVPQTQSEITQEESSQSDQNQFYQWLLSQVRRGLVSTEKQSFNQQNRVQKTISINAEFIDNLKNSKQIPINKSQSKPSLIESSIKYMKDKIQPIISFSLFSHKEQKNTAQSHKDSQKSPFLDSYKQTSYQKTEQKIVKIENPRKEKNI